MIKHNQSKSRSNNFNFLRFFAASLVVFSHSYPLSGKNNLEPFVAIAGDSF